MKFDALLFDFDGVLIESEYLGNKHIADFLTANGRPTTTEESMANFMGYSGRDFVTRLEAWIGGPLPQQWNTERLAENERVLAEGIEEVAGATAFVRSLPANLPKAVVSSSSTRWIRTHLAHLDLADAFGDHVYSGAEHVTRGKPAPDLYLYGAAQLGVPIERCAILEDSPVGTTGAVASGGYVIGLCAGRHCAIGHDATLRAIGVDTIAHDFEDVRRELGL
ncbi:HAD family phosphatase [Sphingomonas sp. NBWT7]|uniref:HAD family hydrolase n=1 Tax=Sphingomonas sp. NBWT7 TaxID=2596913 RepID=UPI0016298C9E|nr:HAD family phosphatase [Sphingomonas sp. NBWT7]QNE32620.1 HAD family phosphatase [Sphingomonas sp. NBWT7]